MPRSQDWVRIGKAARLSGIPARTIRKWAERGRIPCAQIGGQRTWLLVYLPALNHPALDCANFGELRKGAGAAIQGSFFSGFRVS